MKTLLSVFSLACVFFSNTASAQPVWTEATDTDLVPGKPVKASQIMEIRDAIAWYISEGNASRIIGNVGIGTANPTHKLHVSGDASINGLRVGRGAGDIVTNTAVGNRAFSANATGHHNTVIGPLSLNSNTTGSYDTAVGIYALKNNTTGSYNTANGSASLSNNTIGNYNTGDGMYALLHNTTGNFNTATGYDSLRSNTTGNSNIAMGTGALKGNTAGEKNTSLGFLAGENITTGSNNIMIGATTDAFSATGDNQLNIGNWIYGDDGDVFIGGGAQIGGATPRLSIQNKDNLITKSNIAPTEILQLHREGTNGNKWQANAQFKLGSYQAHAWSKSSLEIALTNANTSSIYNTVMTLNGNGRVGIGTSSPGSELDVAGTIRAEKICDEIGANCQDISQGWTTGGESESGGLAHNNLSHYTIPGTYTFTVPSGVTKIRVEVAGAGGGGGAVVNNGYSNPHSNWSHVPAADGDQSRFSGNEVDVRGYGGIRSYGMAPPYQGRDGQLNVGGSGGNFHLEGRGAPGGGGAVSALDQALDGMSGGYALRTMSVIPGQQFSVMVGAGGSGGVGGGNSRTKNGARGAHGYVLIHY